MAATGRARTFSAIGAATDNRFRAFDSKSGKEVWAGQLDWQGNAVPMTYLGKSRKQYVAITASDTVVVFALP
jgi:glucose dehydrogenase